MPLKINPKNNIKIGYEYKIRHKNSSDWADNPIRIPILEYYGKVTYIQKDNQTDKDYYYNPYMFHVNKTTFLNTYTQISDRRMLNDYQIESLMKVMNDILRDWTMLVESSKNSIRNIIKNSL